MIDLLAEILGRPVNINIVLSILGLQIIYSGILDPHILQGLRKLEVAELLDRGLDLDCVNIIKS